MVCKFSCSLKYSDTGKNKVAVFKSHSGDEYRVKYESNEQRDLLLTVEWFVPNEVLVKVKLYTPYFMKCFSSVGNVFNGKRASVRLYDAFRLPSDYDVLCVISIIPCVTFENTVNVNGGTAASYVYSCPVVYHQFQQASVDENDFLMSGDMDDTKYNSAMKDNKIVKSTDVIAEADHISEFQECSQNTQNGFAPVDVLLSASTKPSLQSLKDEQSMFVPHNVSRDVTEADTQVNLQSLKNKQNILSPNSVLLATTGIDKKINFQSLIMDNPYLVSDSMEDNCDKGMNIEKILPSHGNCTKPHEVMEEEIRRLSTNEDNTLIVKTQNHNKRTGEDSKLSVEEGKSFSNKNIQVFGLKDHILTCNTPVSGNESRLKFSARANQLKFYLDNCFENNDTSAHANKLFTNAAIKEHEAVPSNDTSAERFPIIEKNLRGLSYDMLVLCEPACIDPGVVITNGDKKFKVHKIMFVRIPNMCQELERKNVHSRETKENILIVDISDDLPEDVILFMYTGLIILESVEKAEELKKIAETYEIYDLESICHK